MADIELVIKVDERDVELVRKSFKPTGYSFIPTCIQTEFVSAILNGTPLPKGHGRLIDESKVTQVFSHKEASYYKNLKHECVIIDYTDAPTIIEADKAESEEV